MFKPKGIYYEKEIIEYPLGQQLMEKYKDVPKVIIENHNNIEEMRKKKKFGICRYEKKLNNRSKKNA